MAIVEGNRQGESSWHASNWWTSNSNFILICVLFVFLGSPLDLISALANGMHLAQGALGKLDRVGVLACMHGRWGQIRHSVVTWGWKTEQLVMDMEEGVGVYQ